MNTMVYKGYVGSIEVSEEDNCLFGKVLDLPNEVAITFEGAVDDYLIYCEENGIAPQKSYSGTLNVRISPATHGRLAVLARNMGVSLNAFIRDALDKAAML